MNPETVRLVQTLMDSLSAGGREAFESLCQYNARVATYELISVVAGILSFGVASWRFAAKAMDENTFEEAPWVAASLLTGVFSGFLILGFVLDGPRMIGTIQDPKGATINKIFNRGGQ